MFGSPQSCIPFSSKLPRILATVLPLCFTTVLSGPSMAADTVASAKEIQSLFNWAVHLYNSEYVGPPPKVRFEPKQFFVNNACYGNTNCKVIGWYADQNVVHIDDTHSDMESLFSRSLLVHEFVHFLQHSSGNYEAGKCEDSVAREMEAYAVQQEYFVYYGQMPAQNTHYFSCDAIKESA